MIYISVLLFTLSLDAFFVGLSFGAKKIKLPWSSGAVIFFVSLFIFSAAAFFGQSLFELLPSSTCTYISAAVFILAGLFMVFESLLKPSETKSIRVRPLKLVITIMREPAKGDIDSSHIIDSFEALYIGTALSIDSAAAGAAAFASGSGAILLAPFVAFFNTLFIIAGILLGSRITISSKRFSLLPGILLIAVGVFHLFS